MVDEVRRVQSVERAMTLLETIALAGGEARLSELAQIPLCWLMYQLRYRNTA